MINPELIDKIFSATFIRRWNDFPRLMELTELDKQAHKFIIAYLLAKCEDKKEIDMKVLIEAGIFEFLRRVVVTDIRPDVFHKAIEKKEKEINNWVLDKLKDSLINIEKGAFYSRFENYLNDSFSHVKERSILKAASYLSTRWEFQIIYESSKFLNDIGEVKKSVDEELKNYYNLVGIKDISISTKIEKIIDLSGRLRFQKRWAQAPRIPETSVLGHMLIVAILSYFFSLKIDACKTRVENNFYCALFHDFPEALTRDIISPVKYSVSGLDEIINEFEMQKINEEIMPFIPKFFKEEFLYILGVKDGTKDEFENRIFNNNKIIAVNNLDKYNEDKYNAIDGVALKNCDKLAAFLEAKISLSCGIKSGELIGGKYSTFEKIEENGTVSGVNFYKLACEIDNFYKE